MGREVGNTRSHHGFAKNKSWQANCISTLARVDLGDTTDTGYLSLSKTFDRASHKCINFCMYLSEFILSPVLVQSLQWQGMFLFSPAVHLHFLVHRLSTDSYGLKNMLLFSDGKTVDCFGAESDVLYLVDYILPKNFLLRDWCQADESPLAMDCQVLFSIQFSSTAMFSP